MEYHPQPTCGLRGSPRSPPSLSAARMRLAVSPNSLIKCWERRVAGKRAGSLPERCWKGEKQPAALPVGKPRRQRGAGRRGEWGRGVQGAERSQDILAQNRPPWGHPSPGHSSEPAACSPLVLFAFPSCKPVFRAFHRLLLQLQRRQGEDKRPPRREPPGPRPPPHSQRLLPAGPRAGLLCPPFARRWRSHLSAALLRGSVVFFHASLLLRAGACLSHDLLRPSGVPDCKQNTLDHGKVAADTAFLLRSRRDLRWIASDGGGERAGTQGPRSPSAAVLIYYFLFFSPVF